MTEHSCRMHCVCLIVLNLLLCRRAFQQSPKNEVVQTVVLEDPLMVSTLASADSPFATDDPNAIGEVCIVSTSDDGRTISLTPSPALFKRMGVEVHKSSSDHGNVTAVDQILYDGYSKAVRKRLVTFGTVASVFSVIRKAIAAAAIFFTEKALYDNPLREPQPPTIIYTHKNLEDLDKPGLQDNPSNKPLIMVVKTMSSGEFTTITVAGDDVPMPSTVSVSASSTTSATATKPSNCPVGTSIVKCDAAICLGIKNPAGKGKICTKDPLKGCDCDYCTKEVNDMAVCSDQKLCKGAVIGDDSIAAHCTTGDQQDCDCKCELGDDDAPMCDADKAKCDPNKADICQKQSENTIGCECVTVSEVVVDRVNKYLVAFMGAVDKKLKNSETTGYMALTSMLPDLPGDQVNTMLQEPGPRASGLALKAGPRDEPAQSSSVECNSIKDMKAANWTAKFWDVDGNWINDISQILGKDYNTLTNNNPWRYNNPKFLNDPIDEFCKKAVATMPKEGYAAGSTFDDDKKPHNKDTLEEVQFAVKFPSDGGATTIKHEDCVGNLKGIAPKCQIFQDSHYAVWGGKATVDNVEWHVLPQYLRQPAVERPTAYARQAYAPGRTTYEVHGAGWLTNDYGAGLYEKGGDMVTSASESGRHLYFTPSGFPDPFGMEWWANGQFYQKAESIRKEWVEKGVSDHGGPHHSIKWWNDKGVQWPSANQPLQTKDWNKLFDRNTCVGSAPGCAAKSNYR